MKSCKKSHTGFSLLELLMVIAIIAILIALLIPSIGVLPARAKQAKCAKNLKSAGVVFSLYASENNGSLPVGNGNNPYTFQFSQGDQIDVHLRQLQLTPDIFYCPSILDQVENIKVEFWNNRQRVKIHGISNSEFVIGYSYVVNPHNTPGSKHRMTPVQNQAEFFSLNTTIMADTCAAWRPPNSQVDPREIINWRTFPHDSTSKPRSANSLNGDGSVTQKKLEDLRWGYRYHHGINTYW